MKHTDTRVKNKKKGRHQVAYEILNTRKQCEGKKWFPSHTQVMRMKNKMKAIKIIKLGEASQSGASFKFESFLLFIFIAKLNVECST